MTVRTRRAGEGADQGVRVDLRRRRRVHHRDDRAPRARHRDHPAPARRAGRPAVLLEAQVDHPQVFRPYRPAHRDEGREVGRGEEGTGRDATRTRPSTRPPPCGPSPRARSAKKTTRPSTSTSATTTTIRWPGRMPASRARANTPSCSTSPARAPFDLWDRNARHGIKLYVRRVFIMDDAEQLMPLYLRFVRGVVDSADLPLNVSREILQESKDIEAIRKGCTNKVLGLLADLAEKRKGEVRPVLGRVRQGAQGRRRRRLRQQGKDRRPAALRLDAGRHHRRNRVAGRLHRRA